MNKFLKYYASTYKGIPRNAWLLSAVVLINRSGGMVLFFLSLYLTKELGHSVSTAGAIISVYGIGSLVGSLLGGYLTDKVGPNNVMLFSLLLGGFGFIAMGQATDIYILGVLTFIAAALNESFRPANATAFADACPPEVRARGYVLNRTAINLGVTIGPGIGGFLAMISYSILFWVDGLTCILAAIVFWVILPKSETVEKREEMESKVNFASPYHDKLFLLLLFFLFGMGICFVQLFNTWPLYLKDIYFFDEDIIGILLAVNAFTVVLLEMPLIHRLEKGNTVKPMIIGTFLLFAGFCLLPWGNGFGFALFAVLIWTFGEILVFPLMATYIANRASDKTRGKYMGLFTFTFSLAFIIGPIVGTTAYQIDKGLVFYLLSALGVIITLMFVMVEKKMISEQ